jgi:hypothetical protein
MVMKNFHSDEWIMARMEEIYALCADRCVKEDNIVGLFYYGSGNYGLDTEQSDVDTVLLVTPTLDQLINGEMVTYETTTNDTWHIVVKDIRLWYQSLTKPSISILETLFTDYKIVNPKYKDEWDLLTAAREDLVRLHPLALANNIRGMAKNEHKRIHDGREDYPKCLSHLFRLEYLLLNYMATKNYEASLKEIPWTQVKEAKEGKWSLEEAKAMADMIMPTFELFKSYFPVEPSNQNLRKDYREVVNYMVRKCVKEEANG